MSQRSLESVRVYYNARGPHEVVMRLVKEREPVNIAMNLEPDGSVSDDIRVMYEAVLDRFGYLYSAYRNLMMLDDSDLPPSFALYIHALFKKTGMEAYEPRHVINLIGYAFDHQSQPDFLYFSQGDLAYKKEQLQHRLRAMWYYMLQCAQDIGVQTIVLAFVGGGAFATHFPREFGSYVEMLGGALLEALRSTSHPPTTIEVMDATSCPQFFEFVRTRVGQSLSIRVQPTGRIPAILLANGAEDKLFVNAWDPHSIVGNGNKGDPSLDGFMGRNSNMAYASFFHTNPRVLSAEHYHPVDVPMHAADIDFQFPTTTVEAVPGLQGTIQLCRAEQLAGSEALEYTWLLYLATHHTTPLTSIGGTWAERLPRLPADAPEALRVRLRPQGIVFQTVVMTHELGSCTVYGGLPSVTSGGTPSLGNLKGQVFDAILRAVILRTGPVQQFDADELFGFKEYLMANYNGQGTDVNLRTYSIVVGGQKYHFWYNPNFQSVNMQADESFRNEDQNNKIGISFRREGNELKVDQIRESNRPVDRVNDNYLSIFNQTMRIIADVVKGAAGMYSFGSDGAFVADVCWLRINSNVVCQRLYERHMLYPGMGHFQVILRPISLIQQLFPGDAIDAGGLAREFVTRLCKTMLHNSPYVVMDEIDFYAKGSLVAGDSDAAEGGVVLSPDERSIFLGLGALICHINRQTHNSITLGPVFSPRFYKYAMLPSDDDRVMTMMAGSQEYEQKLVQLMAYATHREVASMGEEEIGYILRATLDDIDETFLESDEWTEAFWTEERWSAAKAIVLRKFRVQYHKYFAVFECVREASGPLGAVVSNPDFPLNVRSFTVPQDFAHSAFRTFRTVDLSGEARPAKLGTTRLILAALFKYLHTGEPGPYRSANDENGVPWVAEVSIKTLWRVEYRPNLAEDPVYVDGVLSLLDDVCTTTQKKIQGELDRAKIVREMTVHASLPNVGRWLGEFIRDSTETMLEQFLQYVTGSVRLLPGQVLHITMTHGDAISAHTCFFQVDMPLALESGTRENFMAALMGVIQP